jgi:hypothetical protein
LGLSKTRNFKVRNIVPQLNGLSTQRGEYAKGSELVKLDPKMLQKNKHDTEIL